MKTIASKKSHRTRRVYLAPANIRVGSRVARGRVVTELSSGELWTDDQLLSLGADTDTKYELWEGKVVAMPPGGFQHGAIIMRLAGALSAHVYQHRLGELADGQTGFRLSIDYCFEPDISFVSRKRLKLITPVAEKFFHGAPDLAVEVLSPSDSITKTERKLQLCIAHGSALAWMVDPKTKTVRVYRANGETELLRGDRILTGNSVLPGFRISLSRLFEPIGN